MNRPQLYKNTVDRMVQAFTRGVLEHRSACGCWAGNMLFNHESKASYTQFAFHFYGYSNWFSYLTFWRLVVRDKWSIFEAFTQGVPPHNSMGKSLNLIRLKEGKSALMTLGYSMEEISELEYAFEGVALPGQDARSIDPDGYQGMMAVLDKLQEIHEVDQETTEQEKLRFIPQEFVEV